MRAAWLAGAGYVPSLGSINSDYNTEVVLACQTNASEKCAPEKMSLTHRTPRTLSLPNRCSPLCFCCTALLPPHRGRPWDMGPKTPCVYVPSAGVGCAASLATTMAYELGGILSTDPSPNEASIELTGATRLGCPAVLTA